VCAAETERRERFGSRCVSDAAVIAQIAHRLQITLDQLNTKAADRQDKTAGNVWWQSCSSDFAHELIEFEGGSCQQTGQATDTFSRGRGEFSAERAGKAKAGKTNPYPGQVAVR
jgi:hypothetical protein